jgi:uncharacterized protein
VRLVGGPLAAWQQRNGEATIPHCIEQLEVSGVLDNFRRLLGESDAQFRGLVFADSDLYKVIEPVAWEIARTRTRAFDPWLDDVVALVARVQQPSGYLDTWIQGVAPEKKFAVLEWTHETYLAGHLIQAAVALARADARTDLLDVARRLADLLVERSPAPSCPCASPDGRRAPPWWAPTALASAMATGTPGCRWHRAPATCSTST